VVRLEAAKVAERVIGLISNEDAGLAVERTFVHPYVGEDAFALLAAPSALARPAARSIESTTRKGIVAHAVSHKVLSLG
jgi:hypothetical protein